MPSLPLAQFSPKVPPPLPPRPARREINRVYKELANEAATVYKELANEAATVARANQKELPAKTRATIDDYNDDDMNETETWEPGSLFEPYTLAEPISQIEMIY